MLKISMFGTGQARYNDLAVVDFPNQQPSLLLCYLLLNKDHPHHREQLSTLFWGDSPTRTARKRLRNTLWRLGKMFQAVDGSLEDYFLVADETIAFIPTSQYWLDFEIFSRQVDSCKDIPGSQLSAAQAAQLESAVNLYQGDLLESVYEDWLLYDREHCRMQYLNTLNKLMIYHGVNNNYEQGLSYGEAILARENTREKVHRQMMWLYALAGNREAALSQYRRCCQVLLEEYGVTPMAETHRIFEALQANQFDPHHWGGMSGSGSPAGGNETLALQPIIQRALQRLQNLQDKLAGTHAELQALEQLISQALNQTTKNHSEFHD